MTRGVELRRRTPAGGIEVIGRVTLTDRGLALVEAGTWEASAVEQLLDEAGVIGADGTELHRRDGVVYVEAVTWSFRGSRLWAEPVLDDDG